jgi:predicted Fe-Mo cluster-binding NifX family protein
MSESPAVPKRVIAVPSMSPGGLEAQRSGHFGHCDLFTLVKVDGDAIVDVSVVDNTPHTEGGCLDPVRLLASVGTTEIVVGGMGARPLAFFAEMDITVYADQERATVGAVIDALLDDSVAVMSPQQVCGGGTCH